MNYLLAILIAMGVVSGGAYYATHQQKTAGDPIAGATSVFAVQQGGTGAQTFSSGQVLYGSATNPLQTVSTSSLSLSAGLTNTGTLGAQLGGSALTLKQVENRGFSYATSTAWVGTTTIQLGLGYGEVWNTMRCYTNVGTLNVDFYHASTHFTFFNASTTVGTTTMNATDTYGDKVAVDIGTPATAPTYLACTVKDTN